MLPEPSDDLGRLASLTEAIENAGHAVQDLSVSTNGDRLDGSMTIQIPLF